MIYGDYSQGFENIVFKRGDRELQLAPSRISVYEMLADVPKVRGTIWFSDEEAENLEMYMMQPGMTVEITVTRTQELKPWLITLTNIAIEETGDKTRWNYTCKVWSEKEVQQ